VAGRIVAEDIAAVKERTSIEAVVTEHVSLRPAGMGSLKGLCPFHDEKTPSFHVRPAVGSYYCFGCGESGDVISFVMALDHLTFSETIERLAAKLGMELRYEEGQGPGRGEHLGKRSRLIEAHRVAEEFYAGALVDRPDARMARDFLRERGFDRIAAERFGVGYAPRSGEELTRHLLARGFTSDELVAAGLTGRSARGVYDRFRGRLLWPIRDITGDTIGFGARRLFEDDRNPAKYLNTSETSIYKKSAVLYGLDLAKKAIAGDRRAVVVEGYTDVMAAHLSGVEGAVATCGTAFGLEHIKILRRIMRDEADQAPARVIFTFDGDAAGQKAAMKAFGDDQRWAAQSFVAVAPDGMDPCELRLARGEAAVKALVEDAVPMFEFAVRTVIDRFDLDHAEGRVQAMKAAAPIVATIRDASLRPEYTRTVAMWLGVEVDQVADAVRRAKGARLPEPEAPPAPADRGEAEVDGADTDHSLGVPEFPAPDLRDPGVFGERQLLQSLIQYPQLFSSPDILSIPAEGFTAPAHRAVFAGVRSATGTAYGTSTARWVADLSAAVPDAVRPLVAELSVAPLPTRLDAATGLPEVRYVHSLAARVREGHLARRIADVTAALRRLESAGGATPEDLAARRTELAALQRDWVLARETITA
jgi:DNA primase